MNTTTKLIQALEAMIDASRESSPTALAMRIDTARRQAEDLLAELKPAGPTINDELELYTIPCGSGYTCLGFDVLMTRYNAVAAWLRSNGLLADNLPPQARGSMRAYTGYRMLMDRAAAYCQRNNLRCPTGLTPQLIGLEGKRVEVTDCDGERRRFLVGKSTGWQPCHLEIARRNCSGGPAVSGAPFQSVRVI